MTTEGDDGSWFGEFTREDGTTGLYMRIPTSRDATPDDDINDRLFILGDALDALRRLAGHETSKVAGEDELFQSLAKQVYEIWGAEFDVRRNGATYPLPGLTH